MDTSTKDASLLPSPLSTSPSDAGSDAGAISEVRRSGPPPPPSRRPTPPPPAVSGVAHHLPLPPPLPLLTPAPPSLALDLTPHYVESSHEVLTNGSTRAASHDFQASAVTPRVKPAATSHGARAPWSKSALYQRPQDIPRPIPKYETEHLLARHHEQLDQLRRQHELAIGRLKEEHERELLARTRAFEEQQAQRAVAHDKQLAAARRRIAFAAHLALEDRQGLLRHLEAENDTLRDRVHTLEAELGWPSTAFEPRPKTPSLPPEMFATTSLLPEADSETAADTALQLDPTAAQAPPNARSDDLTRLRGVGPAIARSLAQHGITSFAQIAAWTNSDIDRIAPLVRTRPHRIRKEAWVKWAQRLMSPPVD